MFDRSDGVSLRSGFLSQSAIRPHAPAIVMRGARRSYGEVEETARRWAGAIIEASRSRPERVGLFGYRSEVSYCGALAALFSGAAFVPLNPGFPVQRTAFMIQQAGLDAIIVDRTCAAQLPDVLAGMNAPPLIMPDLDSPRIPGLDTRVVDGRTLGSAQPLRQLPPVTGEDIAYILFTSGSTGTPKGVPVTHGNVMHFLDSMGHRYSIRPEDRISQTFDQTFRSVGVRSVSGLVERRMRVFNVERGVTRANTIHKSQRTHGLVFGSFRTPSHDAAKYSFAGDHADAALEPILR